MKKMFSKASALLVSATLLLSSALAQSNISLPVSAERNESVWAVALKPIESDRDTLRQAAWEKASKEFEEKGYENYIDKANGAKSEAIGKSTAICTYYLQNFIPMLDTAYEKIGVELMKEEGIAESSRIPYSSDHRVIYLELTDAEKEKISQNDKVMQIEPLKPYDRPLPIESNQQTRYWDFTPEERISLEVSEKMESQSELIPVIISFVLPYGYVDDDIIFEMEEIDDLHPEIFEDTDIISHCRAKATYNVVIPLREERCLAALQYEADMTGFTSSREIGFENYTFITRTLLSREQIVEMANLPEVLKIYLDKGDEISLIPATENTSLNNPLKKGDVNGDNTIDIMDVIRINKCILGIGDLSNEQSAAADVNDDEKLDSTDSLMILKEALEITKDYIEK